MESEYDNYDLNSERVINFDTYDTQAKDLYFLIGDRSAFLGEVTFITVSLSIPAKVGNTVCCEFRTYEVLRIEDERKQKSRKWNVPPEKEKNFTFQKLIVKRIN